MSIIRMNGWKKYIRMQRLSDKAAGDSIAAGYDVAFRQSMNSNAVYCGNGHFKKTCLTF